MIIIRTKRLWIFFFQHQFFRYCFAGVTGAIVDFSLFFILTRFFEWHIVPANVLSFLTSAVVNYTINRLWTFKSTSNRVVHQFLFFIIVAGIGVVINTSILYFLVSHFSMFDILAKAVAVVIVMFWNYVINKHVTFKRI